MPLYEYYCHECDDTFTERRSFAKASEPAACGCGSLDTRKLLATIATMKADQHASIPLSVNNGGCCGGGRCGCG